MIRHNGFVDAASCACGLALLLFSAVSALAVTNKCLGHYDALTNSLTCTPMGCPAGCTATPGSGYGQITIAWSPPNTQTCAYSFCLCAVSGSVEDDCCHIVSYDDNKKAATRGDCNDTACWGGTTCIAVYDGETSMWNVWCNE
jgi:hypothetical protein